MGLECTNLILQVYGFGETGVSNSAKLPLSPSGADNFPTVGTGIKAAGAYTCIQLPRLRMSGAQFRLHPPPHMPS